MLVEATAIIPTADRAQSLQATLESIALQDIQPAQIIVVDASGNNATKKICGSKIPGLNSLIIYKRANQKGAASQRNQAMDENVNSVIFFFDDDILMEPGCIAGLWNCLQSDPAIGGVNAMVTNQQYHTPGKLTRFMYRVMSGKNLSSYAGKCIGPAWNLLPEDNHTLPAYNEVEWLNTTCTVYRKDALPDPLFSAHFKGYSLMEDLALSLQVAKKWKLYNARVAKIYHDSQPGAHKNSIIAISKMELVNRHYIMAKILNRSTLKDYLKLFLFEVFGITVVLTSIRGWKNLIPVISGKFMAVGTILLKKSKYG
jgi:GT2 family glycosyltransferase